MFRVILNAICWTLDITAGVASVALYKFIQTPPIEEHEQHRFTVTLNAHETDKCSSGTGHCRR